MRTRTEWTAAGPSEPGVRPRPGRLRWCMETGARLSRAEMTGFVVGPNGALSPDLGAGLTGWGIWLSARMDVLEGACREQTLCRILGRITGLPVTVPPELTRGLRIGITRRISELLKFAAGFGKRARVPTTCEIGPIRCCTGSDGRDSEKCDWQAVWNCGVGEQSRSYMTELGGNRTGRADE
jgi:predicted RNA-binding protein YlxR (DUF448 family)